MRKQFNYMKNEFNNLIIKNRKINKFLNNNFKKEELQLTEILELLFDKSNNQLELFKIEQNESNLNLLNPLY